MLTPSTHPNGIFQYYYYFFLTLLWVSIDMTSREAVASKSVVQEWQEQAGAELGQAQLKLELELCHTSFEILNYR